MDATLLTNASAPISNHAEILAAGVNRRASGASAASLRATSPTALQTSAQDSEEKALKDTAQRFEALLLHTMLKSMRKTTLSENNSNERAVYDDMFDDRIATLVSQSGRLGVSDAIMRQLRPEEHQRTPSDEAAEPSRMLRQILEADRADSVMNRDPSRHADSAAESLNALTGGGIVPGSTVPTSPLRNETVSLKEQRDAFLKPLMSHADISARRLGTSPRAVLAVAALETGWGKHSITDAQGRPSNNLFGIKAQSSDQRSASASTTEYINGRPEIMRDRFKVYDSPAASVAGFADFILDNPRYATALQHASDPERFLVELQRAGYATDPDYAEKAISVMRRIDTHQGVAG